MLKVIKSTSVVRTDRDGKPLHYTMMLPLPEGCLVEEVKDLGSAGKVYQIKGNAPSPQDFDQRFVMSSANAELYLESQ